MGWNVIQLMLVYTIYKQSVYVIFIRILLSFNDYIISKLWYSRIVG